jgi:hypothetical protein
MSKAMRETAGKALRKDAEAGKATFVSHLGVDGAKARATALVEEAKDALAPYGEKAQVLRGNWPSYIIARDTIDGRHLNGCPTRSPRNPDPRPRGDARGPQAPFGCGAAAHWPARCGRDMIWSVSQTGGHFGAGSAWWS